MTNLPKFDRDAFLNAHPTLKLEVEALEGSKTRRATLAVERVLAAGRAS